MEIRRQAKRKKDSATTIKCSFLSMDLLEDEIRLSILQSFFPRLCRFGARLHGKVLLRFGPA